MQILKSFQSTLEKIANFFFTRGNEGQIENVVQLLENPQALPSSEHKRRAELLLKLREENNAKKALNKQKRNRFEKSLQNGIVSLYLDPRVGGTRVPENFAGSSYLVLNYSYRFGIDDFSFDDEKVVATLSFAKVPFCCVVPWDAVFGIADKSEELFYQFSEFPEELLLSLKKTEKPKLTLVEGQKEEKRPDDVASKPSQKPKLTLIKCGKK